MLVDESKCYSHNLIFFRLFCRGILNTVCEVVKSGRKSLRKLQVLLGAAF